MGFALLDQSLEAVIGGVGGSCFRLRSGANEFLALENLVIGTK